jgi:thiamine biosynthesis lipoprotein
MRRVEQVMGLPITVDIPNCDSTSVFHEVFTRFHKIDERYSTYKNASEVSRFARGELKEDDLSDELKFVIEECRKAEDWTGGYFSAWAAGVFDPSGYVKGWAIAEAGKIIEKSGYKTYCVSAGGDIKAASDSGKIWRIGIQDPRDKSKILNMLSISNGAVCTSGNYERGAHIINPKTKEPANELLSVTITGPDIIKADILATASFAMGRKAAGFMKSQKDFQALIVPKDSKLPRVP